MSIILPNDEQTEVYLLACIMCSVNAANYALPLLDDSDFHHIKHKPILKACQAIYKLDRPVVPDAVIYELDGQKKLEDAGGYGYVFGINGYAALNAPYEAYFDRIKNLSMLRKLLYLAQELSISASSSSSSAQEIIKDVQNKLLGVMTNEKIQTRSAKDLNREL